MDGLLGSQVYEAQRSQNQKEDVLQKKVFL